VIPRAGTRSRGNGMLLDARVIAGIYLARAFLERERGV
jgi:hypothetical protein